jgi:hypothetical protein
MQAGKELIVGNKKFISSFCKKSAVNSVSNNTKVEKATRFQVVKALIFEKKSDFSCRKHCFFNRARGLF